MNVIGAEFIQQPEAWISGSRPFLVGVDETRGSSCVTVHATREAMTRGEARQLRRQLREEGVFSRFRIKRYTEARIRKARSVESFLSPFNHDHIVYDASGLFVEAQRLVNFAYDVRTKLEHRVASLLWQRDPSTLFIVLDASRFPRNGKARRADLARVAVQVRKALLANCGPRIGESITGVKITFSSPDSMTMPVDDLSLSPQIH